MPARQPCQGSLQKSLRSVVSRKNGRAKVPVRVTTVRTEHPWSILVKLLESDIRLPFVRPRSDRIGLRDPLFLAKAGSNSRPWGAPHLNSAVHTAEKL